MTGKLENGGLLRDIVIILISIFVAILLAQSGILNEILLSAGQFKFVGNFIAGMFFTSVFTTPVAIVALGEMARVDNLLTVSLLGGLGAIIGDLVIFWFIRDQFAEHVMSLVEHRTIGRKIKSLFSLKYFRWFTFLLGGLIISSPFPDELGIGLLGFSKMRLMWFIPISFVFNSIGILLIGIVARAI